MVEVKRSIKATLARHSSTEQLHRIQTGPNKPESNTDTMRTLFGISLVALIYFMHVHSDGQPQFSVVCFDSVCLSSRQMLSVCVSLCVCIHSSLGGALSAPGVLSWHHPAFHQGSTGDKRVPQQLQPQSNPVSIQTKGTGQKKKKWCVPFFLTGDVREQHRDMAVVTEKVQIHCDCTDVDFSGISALLEYFFFFDNLSLLLPTVVHTRLYLQLLTLEKKILVTFVFKSVLNIRILFKIIHSLFGTYWWTSITWSAAIWTLLLCISTEKFIILQGEIILEKPGFGVTV